MVEVRIAQISDAPGIMDIYVPYILNTAISFETEIPPLDQFEKRIEKCLQKYPWLVCTIDELISCYVYASIHREREAYQWTCECSVYVRSQYRGRGIGKIMYDTLFHILRMQGFKNVYAGITLPNEASIKLHEKCGFERFATYENIGYKLGGWKTVGWWRLQINDYDQKPAPPIMFPSLDQQLFIEQLHKAEEKIKKSIY